jgi:hypothetical protein
MPHRPSAAGRIALVALLCLGLLACERGTPGHGAPIGVAAKPPARAARKPADAVNVLRDRLLARDGAGFARLAVPPALHGELVQGWLQGRSRWPLDELPLDARIPKMLASLQEKNAESKLMATFRRQFAGADRDIDQAIRTLVLFGGEYVQKEADYTPEEREHVAQALVAVGDWARAAPLSDPKHAQAFFGALVAAANRSGIDGKAGNAAYAVLGMQGSLNRLSPFIATLLAQLRIQYGLDADASLRGMDVRLLEQTGDTARLRLRYTLAGQPIDAIVPVVRIDGHWYLADFVRRAEVSLAAGTGETGVKNLTSP